MADDLKYHIKYQITQLKCQVKCTVKIAVPDIHGLCESNNSLFFSRDS